MVKTPEEIERLRKASKIAETAINRAFRPLKPGVKESTIVDAYHEELGRRGAKATFMMFGSGSRTSYPHILVSDKIVEANDLVRYDIGCTYDYYHSDMARGVSWGSPPIARRRSATHWRKA